MIYTAKKSWTLSKKKFVYEVRCFLPRVENKLPDDVLKYIQSFLLAPPSSVVEKYQAVVHDFNNMFFNYKTPWARCPRCDCHLKAPKYDRS